MNNSFEFTPIDTQFLKSEFDKAYVYNICRNSISDLYIVQNQFTTDDMGGSAECVDIFIDSIEGLTNVDQYLNKDNYYIPVENSDSGTYNLAGMLDLIDEKGINYKGILVITRIMSNFILDPKETKCTSHYYSLCSDGVHSFLQDNPVIDGWMASNRVKYENKEQLIKALKDCHESDKLTKYSYDAYKEIIERGEF